jgi:hypothetical protein
MLSFQIRSLQFCIAHKPETLHIINRHKSTVADANNHHRYDIALTNNSFNLIVYDIQKCFYTVTVPTLSHL